MIKVVAVLMNPHFINVRLNKCMIGVKSNLSSDFFIVASILNNWKSKNYTIDFSNLDGHDRKKLMHNRKIEKYIKKHLVRNNFRINFCSSEKSNILKALYSTLYYNTSKYLKWNTYNILLTSLECSLTNRSIYYYSVYKPKLIIFSKLIMLQHAYIYYISKVSIRLIVQYGTKLFKIKFRTLIEVFSLILRYSSQNMQ